MSAGEAGPASEPESADEERPAWRLSRDEQCLLWITFLGGVGSIVAGAAILSLTIGLGRWENQPQGPAVRSLLRLRLGVPWCALGLAFGRALAADHQMGFWAGRGPAGARRSAVVHRLECGNPLTPASCPVVRPSPSGEIVAWPAAVQHRRRGWTVRPPPVVRGEFSDTRGDDRWWAGYLLLGEAVRAPAA